jgi:hypothetical protein
MSWRASSRARLSIGIYASRKPKEKRPPGVPSRRASGFKPRSYRSADKYTRATLRASSSVVSSIESPQRVDSMRHWENTRHWEGERGRDPKAAEWALLAAYLARVDCDRDFSSPIHAERMAWVQEVFARLLDRDGVAYALADPTRFTLMNRLRPNPKLLDDCRKRQQ